MCSLISLWPVLLRCVLLHAVVGLHKDLEMCVDISEADECDLCVRSASTEKQVCDMDMDYLTVRGNFPNFEWDVKPINVTGKMTLTLYAQRGGNHSNESGRPIPGCCGIPLNRGRCTASACINGGIYYWLRSNSCLQLPDPMLSRFDSCEDLRDLSRYLYICPSKTTTWMEALQCDCIRYDTYTGTFKPSNDRMPFINASYNVALDVKKGSSRKPYDYACVFSLPMKTVMRDGQLANPSKSMESWLFNRGVYNMPSYYWFNGSVINDQHHQAKIKCDAWSFNGSSVFELTATTSDNSSFTCVVFWPNGTDKHRPFSLKSHVKCMPKNATHGPAGIYTSPMQNPTDLIITITVSVIGGLAFTSLIAYLICRWRRNFRAFMKETKVIPEQLKNVSSIEPIVERNRNDDVKELADLLDENEKNNIKLAYERDVQLREDNASNRNSCNDICSFETPHLNEQPTFDGYKSKCGNHCPLSAWSSGCSSPSPPSSGDSLMSQLTDVTSIDVKLSDDSAQVAIERCHSLPSHSANENIPYVSRYHFVKNDPLWGCDGSELEQKDVVGEEREPLENAHVGELTKEADIAESELLHDENREQMRNVTCKCRDVNSPKHETRHIEDEGKSSLAPHQPLNSARCPCDDVRLGCGFGECAGYLRKDTFTPLRDEQVERDAESC